jgi:hypothetical protein
MERVNITVIHMGGIKKVIDLAYMENIAIYVDLEWVASSPSDISVDAAVLWPVLFPSHSSHTRPFLLSIEMPYVQGKNPELSEKTWYQYIYQYQRMYTFGHTDLQLYCWCPNENELWSQPDFTKLS